ncbi:MAG TPA: APC family permease [Steroidobacteraceae bacterium]|nr:APC family permease [Steroidobacteraceae bacterium]
MSDGNPPPPDERAQDDASARFGYRQELHRTLTTADLVVYGLVFMVPIAPYAVFGFIWHDSKGMVPLAYLVGLIGMLFTACSYATMAQAFPLAGSVYSYVQRGLHEVAGFFSGWLILLDYILIPALLYIISAIALQQFVPGVPAGVWVGAFVALNLFVNLLGIRFTAQFNRYMLILELVALALFVTCGLLALYRGVGSGGLTLAPIYNPAAFSLTTVVGATSIAVLSFLGFDGISTLSEEARGGARAVGRATLLALALMGGLFMLQTWIATDVAHGMVFSSPETAFYEVSERAGGTWLRFVAVLANVLASGIANALVAQAAVSRILYAMARDRKLPSVLARIHPRYRTPYVSTAVVACVSLVVGLFFAAHVDILSRVVNFGALTSFLLLHLAVINHYLLRGRGGSWLRHLVLPLAGFFVIAYVLFEMDRAARLLGACWIGLGALYYVVLTVVLKKSVMLEV